MSPQRTRWQELESEWPAIPIFRRLFVGLFDVVREFLRGVGYLALADVGGDAATIAYTHLEEMDLTAIRKQLNDSRQSIEQQLWRLDALKAQNAAGQEALEKLKSEYSKYKALAELETQKAAAVVAQMYAIIDGSSRRERLWSLGINLVAGLMIFGFGVIASDPAKTLWTNTLNLVLRRL